MLFTSVEKIKYSTVGASFKVTFSVPIDEIGYLQVLYNKYSEVNGCGFSLPTEVAEQTEPIPSDEVAKEIQDAYDKGIISNASAVQAWYEACREQTEPSTDCSWK